MKKLKYFLLFVLVIVGLSACTGGSNNGNGNDEHEHGFGVVFYEWDYSEDYTTATVRAYRECNWCPQIEEETVTADSTVIQPLSCFQDEITRYVATFTNPAFKTQIREKITKEVSGHTYSRWSEANYIEKLLGLDYKRECEECEHIDYQASEIEKYRVYVNIVSYTYDENGNKKSGFYEATNSDGKIVLQLTYTYTNGFIAKEHYVITNDSEEYEVTYEYDSLGRINKVSMEESKYNYEYVLDYSEDKIVDLNITVLKDKNTFITSSAKGELDNNGNVLTFTQITKDDKNEFKDKVIIDFEYDDNLTLTKRISTQYNLDGKKTNKLIEEYNESGKVNHTYESTYSYDSSKIKETCFEYANGKQLYKYIYNYDLNENLLDYTCTNLLSQYMNLVECKYDERFNLLQYKFTAYDAKNRWRYDYIYEYEYDIRNNKTKETYIKHDYEENDISYKNIYEYEYDISNNKIKTTFTYYGDGKNVDFIDVTVYEYNSNDKLLKNTITKYAENNSVIEVVFHEYEYNSQGNLLKSINSLYDENNNLNERYIHEYEYDNAGNQIKFSLTTNSYDELGNIKSNTINETNYEYSLNGIQYISQETFISKDGSKNVVDYEYSEYWKEKNIIYTSYDKEGNSFITKTTLNEYDNFGLFRYNHIYEYEYADDTKQQYLTKHILIDQDGRKTIQYFEYDSDWNKIRTYDDIYNAEGKRTQTTEYKTAPNGKGTIKKITVYKDDGKIKYIKEYEFDESNKCLSEIFSNFDDNGELSGKSISFFGDITRVYSIYGKIINADGNKEVREHEYDEYYNETKFTKTIYDSEGKIIEKKTCNSEYEYDDKNNVTKIIYSEVDMNNNVLESSITINEYEYYSSGNIKDMLQTVYNDNGIITRKYLERFDEDGDYIGGCYYIYTEKVDSSGNYQVIESEYDDNWMMITETRKNYNSNDILVDYSVTEYEYHSNGNISKEATTYYDAEGNISSDWGDMEGNDLGRHVYEHDAEGNSIREVYYYYKDGVLVKYWISDFLENTTTCYDADGNIISNWY